MRQLLTILFFFTFISAFSQTGNFQYLDVQRTFKLGLNGRTVKGISIDTAMVNASVDSLVTQYALKGYLSNRMGPGIPFGEQHQLLGAKYDNSNILEFLDPIVEGTFVTNDEELNAAKQVFVAQQTIFDTWKRFSHGSGTAAAPVKSNLIPGLPSETDSWAFNAGTGQINSTINSVSFIGFVSPQKYSSYNNTIRIKSTNAIDNDYVIYVIAYVEDANDLVPNNAYGLNSADFSYPINTTDQFIPNQHTISLLRGRTDQANPLMQYAIVYDLNKPTQQVLVNGSNLVWNTNAVYNGHEADIQIIRDGDIIKTLTTNWDDAPGGKGALANQLTFDLSSLAITNKFRGAASYGYGAYSQANASFTILSSSSNVNTIYDVRGGQVWTADVPGNYQIDTSKSLYQDYGVRRILYNPATEKTLYIKADRSFSIIADNKVVFDTANDQYEFNEDDFLVQTLTTKQRVSIIPKPERDLIFLTSPAGTITEEDKKRWDLIQFNDSTFLDDRDFSDSGTVTNPIRTKPLNITSIGTVPSYDHDTKTLNIPTASAAAASRFGVAGEDVTATANRTVNMSGFDFTLNNLNGLTLPATGNVFIGKPNIAGQLNSSLDINSTTGQISLGFHDNVGLNAAGLILGASGLQYYMSHTSGSGVSHYLPLTINGQFADANGNIDVTATGDSSGVISFNSRTGVVVPQSGDYSAYYAAISHTHTASQITDFMSAARGAISVTTIGTAGAATYDNTTGVLNIPNYATGGGTGWSTTGNAITPVNFLGTTSNNSLRFRTNNLERMVLDSTGMLTATSTTKTQATFTGFAGTTAGADQGQIIIGNPTGVSQLVLKQDGLRSVIENRYTNANTGITLRANSVDLLNVTSGGSVKATKLLVGDMNQTPRGALDLNNTVGWAYFNNNPIAVPSASGAAKNGMILGWNYSGGIGEGIILSDTRGTTPNADIRIGAFNGTSVTHKMIVGANTVSIGTFVYNASTSLNTLLAPASAALSVESTTQGSIPFPKMTSAQRTAIASPVAGLHVYQTDGTEGVYVYKSSGWQFAY